MPQLSKPAISRYLRERFGPRTELLSFAPLKGNEVGSIKGYGYGQPLLITATIGKRTKKLVLETMSPGPFGHEHPADRAQAMLWDFDSYRRLPRHVKAVGVGAFTRSGELLSVADAEEFFVITEWSEGTSYHKDLERIAEERVLSPLDRSRVRALASYLARIHRRKKDQPDLYRRRLRELLGHGECIMGLTDSYPERFGFITPELLRSIEEGANRWRWQMREHSDRLCQVHGDFHPWNILFRKGTDFSVIDRSRGEWGEAADDLTALSINYLFFSLTRHGKLIDAAKSAFLELWEHYEEQSGDHEITSFAAPFFAFRGLVIAHPLWYPNLQLKVRRTILDFVERVLSEPRFDPRDIERYLETPHRQTNDRGKKRSRSA